MRLMARKLSGQQQPEKAKKKLLGKQIFFRNAFNSLQRKRKGRVFLVENMAIITQELANRRSCATVNTDSGLSAPVPPAAAAAAQLETCGLHMSPHTHSYGSRTEVGKGFGPFGRNLLAGTVDLVLPLVAV